MPAAKLTIRHYLLAIGWDARLQKARGSELPDVVKIGLEKIKFALSGEKTK